MILFYLTSRHGDCGANVMFHKKNGIGYSTNLDALHLFTREEAQRHVDHDPRSLPLLKSEVDKAAIRAVDCQSLDENMADLSDPDALYVLQIKGCWNGNDIAFAVVGGKSYNFDHAWRHNLDQIQKLTKEFPNSQIWPVAYLDTICRRTFQRQNVNTRKMITGAGIKYKKPRKRRPTTGQVRHNCPTCGKIVWDYKPYEAPYCSIFCEP